MDSLRIGIDLGGSKIEGLLMRSDGTELLRHRVPTPRDDYEGTITAVVDLKNRLLDGARGEFQIGIAVPGSMSPRSGLMQNANSTWLNNRPLRLDLAEAIGAPLQIANDANCFALSEAIDGSAKDARIVFGIILGTGCGGGLVIQRKLFDGPRAIAGEWGHNPLPWAQPDEYRGPECWCGRRGCLETWVSGPGLAADHKRVTGETYTAMEIAERAKGGDFLAKATLARHTDRLARGLAHVVNILDPDVIVLGGGLSQLPHLYELLPKLMSPYIFADQAWVVIRPPKWGDASGVRGAARLWDVA